LCSKKDLKMFPESEHTIVGEKGINLSGGQRARVNLARALYSDAQIYLFDDPLSAVDASVAKKIYDNCINSYLSNKIRILVTHQVHFLSSANQIIYLEDGEIQFKGTFNELSTNKQINLDNLQTVQPSSSSDEAELAIQEENGGEDEDQEAAQTSSFSPSSRMTLLKKRSLSQCNSPSSPLSSPEQIPDNSHSDQRCLFSSNSNLVDLRNLASSSQYLNLEMSSSNLVINSPEKPKKDQFNMGPRESQFDEKRTYGAMNWKTYFVYFKVGGGIIGSIFVFLMFISSQAVVVLADFWLSNWYT
jgi:ABC-type sugar transport system ATPase subunit